MNGFIVSKFLYKFEIKKQTAYLQNSFRDSIPSVCFLF